jgi:hypothetical protein
MASSEAFVDVTYRGLDAGRRLKLTDLGPETGYLEMARPLPVGARLALTTDEGCELKAVVVRVHEQVAGAELPPGMRIRLVDAEGEAAEWWSFRVGRSDPVIPAPAPPPKAVPLPIDTVGVAPDWEPPLAKAEPDPTSEPESAAASESAPEAESAAASESAPEAESAAASESAPKAESAQEAEAAPEPEPAAAAPEPKSASATEPVADANSNSSNGERKKRKRRRRR